MCKVKLAQLNWDGGSTGFEPTRETANNTMFDSTILSYVTEYNFETLLSTKKKIETLQRLSSWSSCQFKVSTDVILQFEFNINPIL